MENEKRTRLVSVSELAKNAGGKMWPWRLAKLGYRTNAKQVEIRLATMVMNALRQGGFTCAYDKIRRVPVVYVKCGGKTVAAIVKLYAYANPQWIEQVRQKASNATVVLVKHESVSSAPLMMLASSLGVNYAEYVLSAEEVIAIALDEARLQATALKIADCLTTLC